MGSSSDDFGDGIAVDRNGNVYEVGYSSANWGSPVNDHAGQGSDAFVAKLLLFKESLTPGIPLLLLDFSD